jgi:hypothetical protein
MKNIFIKIGIFLALLGSVGFIGEVIYNASHGFLFERYRTVWGYEIDYFSILLILITSLIGVPAVLGWQYYKERKIEQELKQYIEKQRDKKQRSQA